MKSLRYTVVLLALVSCSSTQEKPTADTAGIPDTHMGLHQGSVFEAAAPPEFKTVAAEAGESTKVARSWTGEPPVIPHNVADYLPITRDSNGCLDCHAGGGDDTPQLPASHRTDLRRSPDQAGDDAVGSRYVCNACHVAQTDAPALVGNSAE